MKLVTNSAVALVLSAFPVHAETDFDQLVSRMAADGLPPRQEELAGQAQDELALLLQDAPAMQVLSGLMAETREQLSDVSVPNGSRDVTVVSIWHENAFMQVDFPKASCGGDECIAKTFYPVIQWRRGDGSWDARPLHDFQMLDGLPRIEGLNAEVTGIHVLDATLDLYLLVGAWPSNRRPAYVGFLVIGFDDDDLVLDRPAFDGMSPIVEATIYDDVTPFAYRDHFHYDPEERTIVFQELQEHEYGRDLVTVPRDASRTSSRILNEEGQQEVRLRYDAGAFVSME